MLQSPAGPPHGSWERTGTARLTGQGGGRRCASGPGRVDAKNAKDPEGLEPEELSALRFEYTSSGKIRLEKKAETKKRWVTRPTWRTPWLSATAGSGRRRGDVGNRPEDPVTDEEAGERAAEAIREFQPTGPGGSTAVPSRGRRRLHAPNGLRGPEGDAAGSELRRTAG